MIIAVMSGNGEIIGITGGIGSGKSVVSRILRLNGFNVYDCDMEAKILMENDVDVHHALVCLLGEETYDSSGILNKAFVSSRIFSDQDLLTGVNTIVHEAVRKHFRRFSSTADKTVFCESAILATSGLHKLCDRVWIVDAPEEIRIVRVRKRNGLDEAEIQRRMKVQEMELSLLNHGKVDLIDNSGRYSLLERISNLLPETFQAIQNAPKEKWSRVEATIKYMNFLSIKNL